MNIWQRLADAIEAERYFEGQPVIVRTLRNLAAEDDEAFAVRMSAMSNAPKGSTADIARGIVEGSYPPCRKCGKPDNLHACAAEDAEREGQAEISAKYAELLKTPFPEISSDARSRAVEYNDPAGAIGEHRSFQQNSPECARASETSESRRAGWESASRNAATPDEGAGSSAPAAGTIPPLDTALVEECVEAADDAAHDCSPFAAGVHAALTHYRERVERPLREALDTYQRLAKNSANSLFDERDKRGKVEAEADRLRGELAAARAGGFIK